MILLLVFAATAAQAQQYPEQPNPPRLVNDFTNTLTKSEVDALESKLVSYDDTTSTQISIVMLRSLDGYPIEDYAFALGDKWGIGRKGKDNGVLFLIALEDRNIFIATGYGMEGALPDGLLSRIIENDIKPAFREGNYYEGLDIATTDVILLSRGEYTGEPRSEKVPTPVFLFIGLFFLFMVLLFTLKVREAKKYALVNGITFMAAWMLLNQARRIHQGSYRGFSGGGTWGGGSWGGGGGGGGGFGGFGGGSFGGGGAGGSW